MVRWRFWKSSSENKKASTQSKIKKLESGKTNVSSSGHVSTAVTSTGKAPNWSGTRSYGGSGSGGSSTTTVSPSKVAKQVKSEAKKIENTNTWKNLSASQKNDIIKATIAQRLIDEGKRVSSDYKRAYDKVVNLDRGSYSYVTYKPTKSYSDVGSYRPQSTVSEYIEPDTFRYKLDKRLSRWSSKASSPTYRDKSQFKRTAYGMGAFGGTVAKDVLVEFPIGAYQTIRHPVQTYRGMKSIVLDPSTPSRVGSYIKTNPEMALGHGAAFYVAPKVYGKIGSTSRNQYVKLATKEKPYSEVFGDFMSKNKADIIRKFEKTVMKGEYKGVHTTDKGFTKFGKKGRRIEDKGVFVGDWGSGNPTWLNIGESSSSRYTLNPFKNVFNRPNVIRVGFKNLKEIPKNVVKEGKRIYNTQGRTAAYNYINRWYDKNAKVDTAYIPFRSERFETPETQAVIPFKYDVKLKRKGNVIQKLKGYREHVVVDGRRVPIKDFKTSMGKGTKIKELNKKYKNIYDDYYYPYEYKTPYNYYKYKSGYKYKHYDKKGKSSYKYSKNKEYKYPKGYPKYSRGGKSKYSYYPKKIPPTNIKTPIVPILTMKRSPNKKVLRLKSSTKKVRAWRPVFLTKDNKQIKGGFFETPKGALTEGMLNTDAYNIHKFKLKKTKAPKYMLRKARKGAIGYKFYPQGKNFIEKRRFRRDKPMENYNWMQLRSKL